MQLEDILRQINTKYIDGHHSSPSTAGCTTMLRGGRAVHPISWLFFAAGPVEAAITNKALGFAVPEGRERLAGYGTFDHAIDALERAVSGPAWICGDRFTAADVYVGAQVDWGLSFGSIPSRPVFEAYAARLRERPAYKRQKELDNALIAKMQKPA